MHSPHIRFLNSITVTVTDIPVLIFKTGDHITLTFHDHIRNIVSVPDRITDDIFQLQRLQRPHPLPELPHIHRYEQQLHPQE